MIDKTKISQYMDTLSSSITVVNVNLICAQVHLALCQLKLDKYMKCRTAVEVLHQSHLED